MDNKNKSFYVHEFLTVLFLIILTLSLIYIRVNKTFLQKSEVQFSSNSEEDKTDVDQNLKLPTYGIIIAGYEGFYVYDTTNKKVISLITTEEYVNDAQIQNGYLYLVDRKGLKIYDFSDPINPRLVNSYSTFGESLAIKVKNGFAYVGDGANGIAIFSLKNNIQASLKQHLTLPGIVTQLEIYENYLFALGPGLGLKIFKITDDNYLEEINFYTDFVSPRTMTLNQEYLAVSDDLLGIIIFKLQDLIKTENTKLDPILIPDYSSSSMQFYNNDLYISTNIGIYVLNIKTKDIKQIIKKELSRASIIINNDILYISNNEDGFYVYSLNNGELLVYHNLLTYINEFVIFEDGLLIEDGQKIVYINNQKEKVWEVFYKGTLKKSDKGFYVLNGNSVTFYDSKNSFTVTFPEEISDIKEANGVKFAIGKESVYNLQDGSKLLEKSVVDVEFVNDVLYIIQDNIIMEVDSTNNSINYKFYAKDKINEIVFSDSNFFISTDKGIYKLDSTFNVLDYFGFKYKPDIVLIGEKYLYFSLGSQLNLIDKKNFNLYKTINLELPILGLDLMNNKLFVSLSSKGLVSYIVEDNFNLLQEENILFIFNAKKFVLPE